MPRDYKRAVRGGGQGGGRGGGSRARKGARQPSRLAWFSTGLASGVLATLGVLWLEPSPEAVLSFMEETRGTRAPAEERAPPPEKPKPRFDFYHLLPEMEVAVPDHELEAAPVPAPESAARAAPAAAPAPGTPARGADTFVIQVGSFRGADDAERLRAMLALRGLEAHIQSVAIDGRDTWHRVRLGPFTSLEAVNAVRRRLEGTDIRPMVVRVKG